MSITSITIKLYSAYSANIRDDNEYQMLEKSILMFMSYLYPASYLCGTDIGYLEHSTAGPVKLFLQTNPQRIETTTLSNIYGDYDSVDGK